MVYSLDYLISAKKFTNLSDKIYVIYGILKRNKMKQYAICFFLVSVLFSDINWFEGSFSNAQNIAGEKLIMIDFYTDW